MKYVSAAALAACLLVVGASGAEAGGDSPFPLCDGYGTPTGNGDGMTKEARGLFGLLGPNGSAGNTRRSVPTESPNVTRRWRILVCGPINGCAASA